MWECHITFRDQRHVSRQRDLISTGHTLDRLAAIAHSKDVVAPSSLLYGVCLPIKQQALDAHVCCHFEGLDSWPYFGRDDSKLASMICAVPKISTKNHHLFTYITISDGRYCAKCDLLVSWRILCKRAPCRQMALLSNVRLLLPIRSRSRRSTASNA